MKKAPGILSHGWIILDKPSGITSAAAVGITRRLLGIRKVGHAGTLDPLATGILPLALGEATKTMPYIESADKSYEFTVEFGKATDTDDKEGQVIAQSNHLPSKEAILVALPGFTGDIQQVPPIYSAILVNGKRAYALAREGKAPELKSRQVTVHRLVLKTVESPSSASFEMDCSKGTYVRAIARDLSIKLGTYGHVTALRRTRVGHFSLKSAISLEKLKEMVHSAALPEAILPVEAALDDILVLALNPVSAQDLKQGRSIALEECSFKAHDGTLVCAKLDDKVIAIGKVEQGKLRPLRVFNL
jgi:tRNA pseudouridine55 synthase